MSTHRRVVAGVSPTDLRPELVTWAASEATARGATLELVTACSPRSGVEPDDPMVRTTLGRAATLAAERQPGLTIDTRVIPDAPELALRTAATGANLLVIGSDRRSAFVEAITGSVPAGLLARHRARRSSCPRVPRRRRSRHPSW